MVSVVLPSKSFLSTLDYHYEKIKQGAAYCLNDGIDSKNEALLFLNEATDLKSLKGKPPKSEPIFHHVLSLSSDDMVVLDDAQLVKYANDYLDRMGFKNNNTLFFVHNDTEHRHLHIVGNRLDNESLRRVEQGFEKINASKTVDRMAKKYGLKTAQEASVQGNRTEEKGLFSFIEKRIEYALSVSTSKDDYRSQLQRMGICLHEGPEMKVKGRSIRPVSYRFVYNAQPRSFPNSSLPYSLRKSRIDGTLSKIEGKDALKRKVSRTFDYYSNIDNLDILTLLLNREGIAIEFSKRADGTIFGIKLNDFKGVSFKGSEIGYSWKKIQEKILSTGMLGIEQKDRQKEGELLRTLSFGGYVNKNEIKKFELHPFDFKNANYSQKKTLIKAVLYSKSPKTVNEVNSLFSAIGGIKYVSEDGFSVSDIRVGGIKISEIVSGGYEEFYKFIENNTKKAISEVLKNNNSTYTAVNELRAKFSQDAIIIQDNGVEIEGKHYHLVPIGKEHQLEAGQKRSRDYLGLSAGRGAVGGSTYFKGETLSEQEERLRRKWGLNK